MTSTPPVAHRRGTPVALWALWVAVSVAPLLAYASPLWNNLLADTPIADLVWIPIIALGWTMWNILSIPTNPAHDDSELNIILGGLLALITGLALVIAPERWPAFFVHDHAGLLLWPLWLLAMTWLLWGLTVTRQLLWPLLYLLLVWPPIFEGLANATQSVLVRWAVAILTTLSHHVTWLSPAAATGTFAVVHHGQPYLVVVAEACSGADSLLGAAIIIPVVWFVFRGSLRGKFIISLLALLGALVLNWVRLAIIVFAVHVIGPTFTFAYIHPVLGFVLFALLAVGVMALFAPFGLHAPALPHDVTRTFPGWGRTGSAIVIATAVAVLLWPLVSLPRGSFGNPSPVATFNVRTFLPSLSAFDKRAVYYANESSVLGLGSATQADLYSYHGGQGQALVEMWSTPDASALATYGFHACLLYHGDNLAATRSFQLVPGVVATAYAVVLPPNHVGGPRSTYVDVEWSDAVSVHGHTQYIRTSIAAFSSSRPHLGHLPQSAVHLLSLSPVQAMIAPASTGHWSPSLLQTRTVLVDMAQQLFAQSLKSHRG
ncbi:MAG: exosortase [Sulfobacillus acidophilus]|uniref:Exosortase n=1 Tax=Sulfobacillus acidophilus TaxID=53633 RepID=A0A2T2WKD2_9FIRM|nr:MAG: exosortase [Sulfobacillus acidophilus]